VVGRERAQQDAHQTTATAAEWANHTEPQATDGQATARLNRDYTNAGATTPGDSASTYNDLGRGAHRGR
jgi:hypothetical protein